MNSETDYSLHPNRKVIGEGPPPRKPNRHDRRRIAAKIRKLQKDKAKRGIAPKISKSTPDCQNCHAEINKQEVWIRHKGRNFCSEKCRHEFYCVTKIDGTTTEGQNG